MTLPDERRNAVIQTAYFLRKLLTEKRVPAWIRAGARDCLRHYPAEIYLPPAATFDYQPTTSPPTLTFTFTIGQAQVVRDAMDLYERLWLGQWEKLDRMAEEVRRNRDTFRGEDPHKESHEVCQRVREVGFTIASWIYPEMPRGASYGVGAPILPLEARRAYEIYKVVDHAIWASRDDRPEYTTSSGDPYLLNYSGDPKIPFTINKIGSA